MNPPRGRGVAWGSAVVSILVVSALIVFQDRCVEEYYLWKLELGDVEGQKAAAAKLAEMRSLRAVPRLLSRMRELAERHYESVSADVAYDTVGGRAVRREVPQRIRAESWRRNWPGRALANIGAPAVPALIRAVQDGNRDVRSMAAATLGQLEPSESAAPAIPVLIRALEDKDPFVRQQAVGALGALRAQEAVPFIAKRMVADDDLDVRDYAAQSLGDLGAAATAAVPALKKALRDRWPVSGSAADTLRRIGAP